MDILGFLSGLQTAFSAFGLAGLIIFCLMCGLGFMIYWVLTKIHGEMKLQTAALNVYNRNEAIVETKIDSLDKKVEKIECNQVQHGLLLNTIINKL